MCRSQVLTIVAAAFFACFCAGCATTMPRNGIPDAALAEQAIVADLPGIRYWGDENPADIEAEVRRRLPNMPRIAQGATKAGNRPIVEVLALSGGGGDGAFGAGLLAGWTERGDRPEFEVVTGVSAGAIIAPFAFLGPSEDKHLKAVWTTYRTSQIATAEILPGLLGGGSALADTRPLAELIAKYVDAGMLRRIADEYAKGRILMIGTTNLDAQRPVVWNMCEIAASGHPRALDLFRKVILASAAIPGAFPPVSIEVTANGRKYEEMHVDGGTTREVFVTPVNAPFRAFDKLYAAKPVRRLYILKNGKIDPEPVVVEAQTIPIAARAISTLIKNQSIGDIYRIYRMAKDDGAAFHFVAVPPTFEYKARELFDPPYQRALYEQGFAMGVSGVPWMTEPPDQKPLVPAQTSAIVKTSPTPKKAP